MTKEATKLVSPFPEISREVTDMMTPDDVYNFVNSIGNALTSGINKSRQAADAMCKVAAATGIKGLIDGSEYMHSGIIEGGNTVAETVADAMTNAMEKLVERASTEAN